MEKAMFESKPSIQQGELKNLKCSKHPKYDKEFLYPLSEEG